MPVLSWEYKAMTVEFKGGPEKPPSWAYRIQKEPLDDLDSICKRLSPNVEIKFVGEDIFLTDIKFKNEFVVDSIQSCSEVEFCANAIKLDVDNLKLDGVDIKMWRDLSNITRSPHKDSLIYKLTHQTSKQEFTSSDSYFVPASTLAWFLTFESTSQNLEEKIKFDREKKPIQISRSENRSKSIEPSKALLRFLIQNIRDLEFFINRIGTLIYQQIWRTCLQLRRFYLQLFHAKIFIYEFKPDQHYWHEYLDLKTTRKKVQELVSHSTNSKTLAVCSQQSFFHYEIHQKSYQPLRAA